jgi:signal transduction histidine kinase
VTSLRARIAVLYAVLLVAVVGTGAVLIDFALRSVLVDQARLALTETANQISRAALATGQTGFGGDIPLALTLSRSEVLDRWASTNQYVQIDTLAGQVLGKSSDMGSITFPPFAPNGAPQQFTTMRVTGDRPGTMLVLSRVLSDDDGHAVAIAHVGERLDIVDQLIAKARTILAWIIFAALAVILVASYFIASSATDPIQRLTAAIAGIGSQRLDRRLRWQRKDELGRLADAFDAMLDRLQSAFARERQFISDASHELRTPLTVINANAQMLQRWGERDPEVLRTSLEAIAEESGRLAEMVSGMLTLSKAESGDAIPKEPVVLERLIDDVVAHASERAAAKGLRIEAVHPAEARTIVYGDAGLLRQLVGNLVDNALKFTDAGSIEVSLARDDGMAVLDVSDTGPGIDESSAQRLFDRFFRGDPSHARTVEGTGLGLAIVRSIARVHGGTVEARARPGGGSLFTVRLPAEPESFTAGS